MKKSEATRGERSRMAPGTESRKTKIREDAASLKDAALLYAQRGWYVFPLKPSSKEPATKRGFKDASNDLDAVHKWWERNARYNIGLWPGPSGLLCFDIDGEDGEATARELGLLDIPTLQVRSGKKGRHLYFIRPEGEWPNKKLGRQGQLEIRCDAGYLVAPPSIHPDTGVAYQWV